MPNVLEQLQEALKDLKESEELHAANVAARCPHSEDPAADEACVQSEARLLAAQAIYWDLCKEHGLALIGCIERLAAERRVRSDLADAQLRRDTAARDTERSAWSAESFLAYCQASADASRAVNYYFETVRMADEALEALGVTHE